MAATSYAALIGGSVANKGIITGPLLPAEEDVELGSPDYGYAGDLQTGTLPAGGGGGDTIEYTIDSVTVSSEPDYIGLKKATVTVRGGRADLIGTTVSVYDHSGCIFDEEDMVGYTGWGAWGQAHSLDPLDECALSPEHWFEINRCCAAGSGSYADCPTEEEEAP
jgi:hypothetical protein